MGEPFKRQPYKIVKHTQTVCRKFPHEILFDHFVRLARKGLRGDKYTKLMHLALEGAELRCHGAHGKEYCFSKTPLLSDSR